MLQMWRSLGGGGGLASLTPEHLQQALPGPQPQGTCLTQAHWSQLQLTLTVQVQIRLCSTAVAAELTTGNMARWTAADS